MMDSGLVLTGFHNQEQAFSILNVRFFSGKMKCRIENVVPQRVAYTEPPVVFLVMVEHVVLLDALPKRMIPAQVVHGVVHHVVAKIAQHETGKKWIHCRLAHQGQESVEKNNCERDTQAGWHHEPKTVVGVVVVDAMPDKMQALAPLTWRNPVKNETVQHIFSERPGKEPDKKQSGSGQPAACPLPQHPGDDGKVNNQRHCKMYL